MEQFKQRLKFGTHIITFAECENPKESILTHKWNKNKEIGHNTIIKGNNAIKRFRDWLNKIDI